MHNKCWLTASIITILIHVSPVTHSQEPATTKKIPSIQWQSVNITEYKPSVGDYLIFYIPSGKGFLANNKTKTYAEFSILSGQPRNVSYIGRYYFAATPEKDWEVKEKNIKRNRFTFGQTGRFFRLFDTDGSTPYGIHAIKNGEKLMDKGQIYASMGCVVVPENTLDTIKASYNADAKNLHVSTTSDIAKISNFLDI
ncbi:hypothetical protein HZA40_04015 [Candidatus Peregrinibacteria bacterium]|nr:hypothetical protein [Candidatus Peregrinibacteria bacterium]